jgi:hypothetical protein
VILTVDQAIERGVVQEINRQLLHPAGYALRAHRTVDGGVWVELLETPPEHTLLTSGPSFTAQRIKRANAFAARRMEIGPARVEALGFLKQPMSDAAEDVIVPTAERLSDLRDAVRSVVTASPLRDVAGDADLTEWACYTLASAVLHVLRDLAVESRDGGASWTFCKAPRPTLVDPALGDALSRGDHLCADIRRLQAVSIEASQARAAATGETPLGGELLPSEWAEFESVEADFLRESTAAVEQLASGDPPQRVPDAMADSLAELERFYGLVQPGMRVARGESDAFALWDRAARPALRDAARESFRRMSEYDRLIARELWPWEDADWPALATTICDELAAAQASQADAERSLQEAMQRTAALSAALDTIGEALERKTEQAK